MAQVKMRVGMAGISVSLRAGDLYECSAEEAARLIEAGFAEQVGGKVERAVKPAPAAKRRGALKKITDALGISGE